MDTPRARSPRPLPPRSSKPTAPLPPPPPRPPLSAATSPSRDFSFAAFSSSASASSSPFGGGHLHHPLSMSRTPVVGRVGSDLSHNNYAKTSRHPTASCRNDVGDRAKNRASPFISGGIGGAWRKENSSSSETTGGGKPAEERRKDKAKRGGLDVSQWVRKRVAAMVEQLRASFSRQAERERREQQRRRPHSFSVHGPNAAREQGRWMRRQRRGHLSSAPASLRVSPANSGHLSVGASVKVSTSSEESTMEELHSAIEAAIAHCKNSISRGQQANDDVDGRRGDRTKRQ